MDTAAHIEQTIRAHRLPGLDAHTPSTFIHPHYDGYAIANLPPTIAAMLGVELPDMAPTLPPALWEDLTPGIRRVVLVILDAVGYRNLRQLADEEPALEHLSRAGQMFPLTSVFPSTTVAALTTLWTGRTPGEHGFLGTKLLLAEQGMLANMLALSPAAHRQHNALVDWGWEPDTFVTVPSLGQQLTEHGVQTIAHTHSTFIGGSLTRIFTRGMADVRGHLSMYDMWIHLRHTLQETSASVAFISVYWGHVDGLAHVYGPGSESYNGMLRDLFRSLERECLGQLSSSEREGTLLLVTADHGQIASPPEKIVWLSEHPDLQRLLLVPPAAESRAAYLYVRPGQADAVRAYVAEHLGGRFLTLDAEQAIATGLFGPRELPLDLRSRVGDLLLLAQDDSRLLVRKEPTPFYGHHGSLTPEEMLVPLLMVRLDQ
ncbi:MAG TPA: alkaline phosphatase family protein [Chloroflexi bacterium]|nr:alkaline phosphatase family protein [Chloroflexota bacterium]